jgi:hypothetical protein
MPLRRSDVLPDRASDVVIERVFVHAPDRFVVVNGFKFLLPVAVRRWSPLPFG